MVNIINSENFSPQLLYSLGVNENNKNRFLIEHKVSFAKDPSRFTTQLSPQELEQCLNFSWEMAYGNGYHKPTRSGGSDNREQQKIFENVLTGKIGEIAFYRMCQARAKCQSITDVDFDSYGAGEWDEYDFEITTSTNEVYKVAIKSSQSYANLLLLEVKDWTVEEGRASYKHNRKGKGMYNYIAFCRAQFGEYKAGEPNFFKKYANELRQKQSYSQIASSETIQAQVVGYVVNEDLVQVMNSGHIIRRNDYMTQNRDKEGMRLDADNYYIQAGCLRKF